MKTFNYILYIVGGLFVAFVFYSFVASLGMFAQNLGRQLTQADINYYYAVKTLVVVTGFFIGIFSFHKLLQD